MPEEQTHPHKRAGLSHWVTETVFEKQSHRARFNDLRCGHSCNPVLIEALLMAERFSQSGRAPAFLLSGGSLTELCQFGQRKKWLCPWGIEYVDETHRPELPNVPPHLREWDRYDDTSKFLDLNEVKRLIDDERNQFERILLSEPMTFDWLNNLHKHPVEEIHIFYDGIEESLKNGLPHRAIRDIARCESLRVLEITNAVIKNSDRYLLERLKNIEAFMGAPIPDHRIKDQFYFYCGSFHTLRYITFFKPLSDPDEDEYEKITWMIRNRKNSLRHIELVVPPEETLYEAIIKIPHLRSFRLHTFAEVYDSDFVTLLSHPNVQQNLRDLYLAYLEVGARTFALIAKLRNLHCIDLSSTKLTGDELNKILRANKKHIRYVRVAECPGLGPEIFQEISECTYLERVTLYKNERIKEAAEEYIREKRPNFGAITFSFE